ncbi:MAG: rhomboid family intramembrane serine protease [Rhizobiaceae bacterium]
MAQDNTQDDTQGRKHPPAFNLPASIMALAAAMIVVHLIRSQILDVEQDYWLLNVFAFVPVFYHALPQQLVEPLAIYWSPISHGFLHGDWAHLIVNLVWLAAFGSAVARRLGGWRFWLFMGLATAAGAGAHYIFHSMSNTPVIGASGAVSACMGAAVRFAFVPGRSIEMALRTPALSLVQSLQNRTIMTFVIVWFAFNFLVGAGIIPLGIDGQIAWEAHMGGFLFGWLCFGFFDPVKPDPVSQEDKWPPHGH